MMHLTMKQLLEGLDVVRQSPADGGALELIVRRPRVGEREVLDAGELALLDGLVGDTWKLRGSTRTPDRLRHPDMQLNIMNARAIALSARDRSRWPCRGPSFSISISARDLPRGTGWLGRP